MATKGLNVRLRALDGQWEEVGRDRLAGIVPENLVASANRWGSDRASFKLARRPGGQPFPDLGAFAEAEIHVAGRLVWSGRVKETPSQDSPGTLSVELEGWQYHLDDDVYEPVLIHSRLSDWVDHRTLVATDLTKFNSSWEVQSLDRGMIRIGWSKGAVLPYATNYAAITLDLGMYARAKRVVMTWQSSNNVATTSVYCRGTDGGDPLAAGYENSFVFEMDAGSSGTSRGTFLTGDVFGRRRYVHILLSQAGPVAATGEDLWLKITSIKLYGETEYESGDDSILKAPVIVKDAVARAPLLSTDVSRVDPNSAATFNFPEFAPGEPRTPREVIDAANRPMQWITQIDVDRRIRFEPPPTAATLEVGRWSGGSFEDTSSNSGADVYNRVLMTATGPDSLPLRRRRGQGELAYDGLISDQPQRDDSLIANPTFASDTSGWSTITSNIARDTVTYESSPASGRWDNSGASDGLAQGDELRAVMAGTFVPGPLYVLRVPIQAYVNTGVLLVQFADTDRSVVIPQISGGSQFASVAIQPPTAAWTVYPFAFYVDRPTAGSAIRLSLIVSSIFAGCYYRLDSLSMSVYRPTIPDRRGFFRTKIVPVSAAFTTGGLVTIADAWLGPHKTAALQGTVAAPAPGAVRRVLGGAGVHPAHLLTETASRVRLSHVIDPDTGALGREAVLSAVSYDDDKCSAALALDNERDRLEPVLERYSLITGSG